MSDGEMGKPSYVTYITDRLDGFGGTSQPLTYADLVDFPVAAREGVRRPRPLTPAHAGLRRADQSCAIPTRRARTSST